MGHRFDMSTDNAKKPSKLLALLALLFALFLPFLLVKTFSNRVKTKPIDSKSKIVEQTAPQILAQDKPSPTEKITQNNVNDLKKTLSTTPTKPQVVAKPPAAKPPSNNGWQTVQARSGDSLSTIFNRIGLSKKTLQEIMHRNPHSRALTRIKANDRLEFLLNNSQLEKMILPFSPTQFLSVERVGRNFRTKISFKPTTNRNQIVSATVHSSLQATVRRQNIPTKLVQQMTNILAENINFAREVREGDQFSILYKAIYVKDKLVDTGEVLAVSYRNKGQTYQAIRHVSRGRQVNYFSANGTTLKKAFDRYPMRFSHISSTFSLSRYHPILKYSRPHKGIDLAARIGTPIRATGDGRIEVIGRQGAYGNMIKIKHNPTYSSLYGHMLKFEKGLSRGSYVKQGQVIGYVGQSGLASGPHCHYEFHVNNQPRNPATIPLPRGNPLYGRELSAFKANANVLLAQINNHQKTYLAKR